MPREDEPTIDRRDCLRTIGTIGATVAGASTIAGASDGDSGAPAAGDVTGRTAYRTLVGEFEQAFSFDRFAQTDVVTLDDDAGLEMTRVRVPAIVNGSWTHVKYGRYERDDTTLAERAVVDCGDIATDSVPADYREAASRAESLLVGTEDGVELYRSASDAERRTIAEAIDVDADRVNAITGSTVDGFDVVVENDGDVDLYSVTLPAVGPGAVASAAAEPTVVEGETSFTAQASGGCGTLCVRCLSVTGITLGCVGACAGLTATAPYVAWLACFQCMGLGGAGIGWICTKCLNCLHENT